MAARKAFGLLVYTTDLPEKPDWYWVRYTFPNKKPVETIAYILSPSELSHEEGTVVEVAGPIDRPIDEAGRRKIAALPPDWRPGSGNAEAYGIPTHVEDDCGKATPLDDERWVVYENGRRAYFKKSGIDGSKNS